MIPKVLRDIFLNYEEERKRDKRLTDLAISCAMYGPFTTPRVGDKMVSMQDMHAMWPEIKKADVPVVLVQHNPSARRVIHFFKKHKAGFVRTARGTEWRHG